MNEYDFTLKFRLADKQEDPETYLGVLERAGCNDALIGVGRHGRIALHFTREADTALEAISSAVANVTTAIPNAWLVEASPDFVGITHIAELLGVSRQYIQKITQSESVAFPEPIHEGKPSLWHLIDVLAWFEAERTREIEPAVFDVSKITMQVNLYLACMKAARLGHERFRFEATAMDAVLQQNLQNAA